MQGLKILSTANRDQEDIHTCTTKGKKTPDNAPTIPICSTPRRRFVARRGVGKGVQVLMFYMPWLSDHRRPRVLGRTKLFSYQKRFDFRCPIAHSYIAKYVSNYYAYKSHLVVVRETRSLGEVVLCEDAEPCVTRHIPRLDVAIRVAATQGNNENKTKISK